MKLPALPPVLEVNAYGLSFGQSRRTTTYRGSGLRFASYYRRVCLRCGWHFAGKRHRSHRLADCDMVIAQWADPATLAWCLRNLYGRAPRSR